MPGERGPTRDALEAWLSGLPAAVDLPTLLATIEDRLVDRALEQSGGVQAEAARHLALSRSDLHYRMRKRRRGERES
jgi:transcriptional regulator with GAF, ATPase, and Fis domain